jgi:acyl-CoA thioester hydrolase
MSETLHVFDFPYTVPDSDIDDLGHAGNFHYVRWMQEAAIAHSSALGWAPSDYDALGAGWVVRSHRITYLQPAFEGDHLLIRTWVADMKPATSLRRFEILGPGGARLATAATDWAFIDYRRQKPTRIPAAVRADFEPFINDSEAPDHHGK